MDESTSTKDYTCSNVKCGKTFAKPLKATNLRQATLEPYDACPYCLNEVAPAVEQASIESTVTATENSAPEQHDAGPTAGNSACRNYFGYLSRQSLKGEIPDECMVCKEVINCMLKKTLE